MKTRPSKHLFRGFSSAVPQHHWRQSHWTTIENVDRMKDLSLTSLSLSFWQTAQNYFVVETECPSFGCENQSTKKNLKRWDFIYLFIFFCWSIHFHHSVPHSIECFQKWLLIEHRATKAVCKNVSAVYSILCIQTCQKRNLEEIWGNDFVNQRLHLVTKDGLIVLLRAVWVIAI